MTENEIAEIVVDCCYKVHSRLGPGLLESVYEEVLAYELAKRHLRVKRQVGIPVIYDEVRMDLGFRADIIVEDKFLVELKSVENLTNTHLKQALTYIRLLDYRLGLLVNFNEAMIRDGLRRVANKLRQ
ncbi:MAG: GxxExxY protein [Dehalococcoidia bacterium]|nr:MAG: GxxExxY protein [Dehalococcoidia bacterium]